MSPAREVLESPVPQGEDERIPWPVDISKWGSNPTDVSVVVKDGDGNDVTATVAEGSATVLNPTTIQCPVIHSLTAGQEYRVEVKFTVSGKTLEGFFIILAEE